MANERALRWLTPQGLIVPDVVLVAALGMSLWAFGGLETHCKSVALLYNQANQIQSRIVVLRERLTHVRDQIHHGQMNDLVEANAYVQVRVAAIDVAELLSRGETSKLLPETNLVEMHALFELIRGGRLPINVDVFEHALRGLGANILTEEPAQSQLAAINTDANVSRAMFTISLVVALFSSLSIRGRFVRERRGRAELQSFVTLFGHTACSWLASLRLAFGGFAYGKQPDPEILHAARETIGELERINSGLQRMAYGKADTRREPVGGIVYHVAAAALCPVLVELDERSTAETMPATQLRALLDELLNNAIVAVKGETEPRILVRGSVQWRWLPPGPAPVLTLEIVDNGVGMAPDVLGQATVPFFSTRGEGHAGLGLTSCVHMARALGGEIVIKSSFGEGTAVHLLLPVRRTT